MTRNVEHFSAMRRCCLKGFTAIELIVTMAVSAILIAIAITSLSDRVRQGRAEGASDGFLRAAASARSLASQTASRTVLLIDSDSSNLGGSAVTGACGKAAWAVVRWVPDGGGVLQPEAVTCLSETDFADRYGKTALSKTCTPDAALPGVCSVRYLPTGIGSNTASINLSFKSGSGSGTKEVKVEVLPGGLANVKS